jgi:hypothetical protein
MNVPSSVILSLLIALLPLSAPGQTRIGREQIEDAFLRKTGGSVYGDIRAATSSIQAATWWVTSGAGRFYLEQDGARAALRSNIDLLLDPTDRGTAGAFIIAATTIKFPDVTGDKFHLFSNAYRIGVSPFNLDITSDRNIRFHSDTTPDLMVIEGDQGNVLVRQQLSAGGDIHSEGVFSSSESQLGDKLRLHGPLYRFAISPGSLDGYSDQYFRWHSDTLAEAMKLDAAAGKLTLKGALKLPVYTTLPAGSIGEIVYFDHATDNSQDGIYVHNGSGWQKL